MTRKTTRSDQRKQARKERRQTKIVETHSSRADDIYKSGRANLAHSQKQIDAANKVAKRERDNQLRALLRRARETGIYNAKANKLTPYRRKRLSKIQRSGQAELLDKNKYFFLPVDKGDRKKNLPKAEQLKIKTSSKGLFVPRGKYGKAVIKRNDKTGDLTIIRSRKTVWGNKRGRTYSDAMAIASVDELTKQKDRLREEAALLGPMKSGDRLAFHLHEKDYDGWSNNTYSDIEQLIEDLDNRYGMPLASKIQFYKNITIEKSSIVEWKKLHPKGDAGRGGRSIRKGANAEYKKAVASSKKTLGRNRSTNTRGSKG
jgi:hypothetical protein